MVQKIELAPNSASADIHILIHSRYAGLVRAGSAFWNTSGVQASGGILKGIEVEIESLRTLYTGAIEFATPSEKAPRVKPGTRLLPARQAQGRMAELVAEDSLSAGRRSRRKQEKPSEAAPDKARQTRIRHGHFRSGARRLARRLVLALRPSFSQRT